MALARACSHYIRWLEWPFDVRFRANSIRGGAAGGSGLLIVPTIHPDLRLVVYAVHGAWSVLPIRWVSADG